MKALVVLASCTIFAHITWAQTRQFRFYLSYGDEQTAALARNRGNDPLASIGREIPQSAPFSVPRNAEFRVQLGVEHLDQGYGAAFVADLANFIAYDRAFAYNLADLGAIPLDSYSFRKISPVHLGVNQLKLNTSSPANRIVYDLDRNTVDQNGDGVPDVGRYRTGLGLGIGGYMGATDDMPQVRPIGVTFDMFPVYNLSNGGVGTGWYKLEPGERMRIVDLAYRSNLQVGETYGYGSGETGLLLHTSGGEQTGWGNNLGYYRSTNRNPEPWQNIGAKYNLIGAAPVPEPNSLLAVALGALLLRRRRAA